MGFRIDDELRKFQRTYSVEEPEEEIDYTLDANNVLLHKDVWNTTNLRYYIKIYSFNVGREIIHNHFSVFGTYRYTPMTMIWYKVDPNISRRMSMNNSLMQFREIPMLTP